MFNESIDLLQTYGVDLALLVPDEDDEPTVVVPETNIELSEASEQILRATVNPLQQCTDFGVQLYKNAVQTVYQLLQDVNYVMLLHG